MSRGVDVYLDTWSRDVFPGSPSRCGHTYNLVHMCTYFRPDHFKAGRLGRTSSLQGANLRMIRLVMLGGRVPLDCILLWCVVR